MRSPKVPWWPGSVVSESGVHLHHLVFGIVTMMISGAVGFTVLGDSPWAEICAFAFGVGAGLTIDEFALWVYLEDVYWSEEGRVSIDATVIAAAVMGLILLGFTPFTSRPDRSISSSASLIAASIVFGVGRDLLRQAAAPARGGRLLRLPGRDLRRRSGSASPARPGRGAATASGNPTKQGRPRSGSPRPPHRALQERVPRHRRRQAERGSRRRDRGGPRRQPRSGRRSPPGGRAHHPPRETAARTRPHSPIALITSRFGRRPSNSQ